MLFLQYNWSWNFFCAKFQSNLTGKGCKINRLIKKVLLDAWFAFTELEKWYEKLVFKLSLNDISL